MIQRRRRWHHWTNWSSYRIEEVSTSPTKNRSVRKEKKLAQSWNDQDYLDTVSVFLRSHRFLQVAVCGKESCNLIYRFHHDSSILFPSSSSACEANYSLKSILFKYLIAHSHRLSICFLSQNVLILLLVNIWWHSFAVVILVFDVLLNWGLKYTDCVLLKSKSFAHV